MLALASLTFNLSSRYNMSNHQVLFIGYYSAVSLPDTLFSVLFVFLVPTEKRVHAWLQLIFQFLCSTKESSLGIDLLFVEYVLCLSTLTHYLLGLARCADDPLSTQHH